MITESRVRISCLAATDRNCYLAAGEGEPSSPGQAQIIIIKLADEKVMIRLTYHQEGVQALQFCNEENNLISIGNAHERSIVIWEVQSGTPIQCLQQESIINHVIIDPSCELSNIIFYTLGNQGHCKRWDMPESRELSCYDVLENYSEYLRSLDFTAGDVVQSATYSGGNFYVVIGTRTGGVLAFDAESCKFMDHGNEHIIMQG